MTLNHISLTLSVPWADISAQGFPLQLAVGGICRQHSTMIFSIRFQIYAKIVSFFKYINILGDMGDNILCRNKFCGMKRK